MFTNIPNFLKDKMLTMITARFWTWFGHIPLKKFPKPPADKKEY